MSGPRTLDATRPVALQAVMLMCVSTVLFGLSDTVVKLLSAGWGAPQLILLRSLACLPLLLLLRQPGEPMVPRGMLQPLVLVRAATEIGVTFTFFLALALLPMGDAITLMFLAPVLLTGVAAVWLGERVGARRWAAVLLGFAGVLVVMRPGGTFTTAALLPLLTAVFIAARDSIVRRLSPATSTRAVVTASTLALLAAGAVTAPFDWRPVGWQLVLGSLMGALLVTLAFVAYVRSTRMAPVAFIQPFRYLSIPYAFVLSWLVWGVLPDGLALVGAVMIVAAGLLTLGERAPSPAAAATLPLAAGGPGA